MSIDNRIHYAQRDAVSSVFSGIDQAWSAAENGFYQAADGVRDAAGYALNDPLAAAQAMGEFAEDAARAAWNIHRDLVGNGLMWANTVRTLLHTPCEDKWTVLLETALPAVGDALWLFIVPSPNEILENYLQPYPTKSGRRRTRASDPDGRRKSPSGRKRRAWAQIPDVDEMIAQMIPGADAVKGRDAGNGTRWLFEGIDLVDRVGWHFLVVDAFDSLFVNWTSNIMQARFCEKPFTSALEMTQGQTDGAFGQANLRESGYSVGTKRSVINNDGILTFGDEPSVQKPATGFITMQKTLFFDTYASREIEFNIGFLVRYAGGGEQTFWSPTVSWKGQQTKSIAVTANFENALSIQGVQDDNGSIFEATLHIQSGTVALFANT